MYIGITSRKPSDRWGYNGIHYKGQPFYKAILKYGWDNIKHEIIYSGLSENQAKEKEIELIKKYKSRDCRYGYNCTYGGDGTVGLKRTKESIELFVKKISKKVYQYSLDGNFIKEWNSGKEIYEELGIDVYACLKNKTKTSHGYVWLYEFYNEIESVTPGVETKHVFQYSLDGIFIKEWKSCNQIENELGFISENIRACCTNKQNYAFGYIWKYEKFEKIDAIDKVTYSQYDFDGNYIQTFSTVPEASKSLGYKSLPIIDVCNGIRKQAGGYQWRYYKDDRIQPYIKNKRVAYNKRKIYQFNLDGTFIKEWNSISDAEKYLGLKNSGGITMCAKGQRNSMYGYIWRYKKDIHYIEKKVIA